MTWWSEWRDVYFQLMTLGTPDFDKPAKQRIFNSGDYSFKGTEIDGHEDFIEEQLWAFRRGLTDIAFWIEIPLRKPMRKVGISRRKRSQKRSQPL